MSDKIKELEAEQQQLNALLYVKTSMTDDIDENIALAKGRITALEAQIAEEKKPKLRHLDIVPDKQGHYHVIIENVKGELHPVGPNLLCNTGVASFEDQEAVGNAKDYIDDLTALSEDVTEFRRADIKSSTEGDLKYRAYYDHDGMVCFDTTSIACGTNCLIFDANELSALILKLRQMEATLKRNSPS